MSVQKPNDNGSSDKQPVAGAMADQLRNAGALGGNSVPDQRRPSHQSRNQPSIFDIDTSLQRPVDRNSMGESVQNFKKALMVEHDQSTKSQYRDEFKLLILDNNSAQVALSAIIVCFAKNDNGVGHVAVNTLIVEGSANKLNNRFESIGGQNIEIEIVAGDAMDSTMIAQIDKLVRGTYGDSVHIHNAGYSVLPTELMADDKSHMYRIWYNATQALFTVMDGELGGQQEPFSVTWIPQKATTRAQLDYNPLPLDNAVGLPVRQDLRILVHSSQPNQNQGVHEQSKNLSSVGAFIDLVYNEPSKIVGYGQAPDTKYYYPRVVITHADSEVAALTPELHMFAIATTTLLSQNLNWGAAYLPRTGPEAQLRDIGAIGYEGILNANPNAPGIRIDTNPETFTRAHLYQLLTTVIHPNLIYSMDLEENGELSWLGQMYFAASSGSQEANNALVEAMDNLTDKHFSRIHDGSPIVYNDMNRIHLGYWKDDKGRKRDLREIDYLAIANLQGAADRQIIIDWQNTYDNVEIPLEMRLERRLKIIRGVLSRENVYVKGYARRITFNPLALLNLNAAMRDCGLTIRPENPITDLTGGVARAQFDARQFAYGQGQAAGPSIYSFSTPGYGVSRMASDAPWGGRWNR